MRPVRLMLVDDHHLMRQGLRSLLDGEQGFEVVAEAADGRQAVDLDAQHGPDIVVMDVGLPGLKLLIESSPW